MEYSKEDNLIKRLEFGTDTKIIFMSHNAYWSYLTKLDKKYDNFSVDVFGGATSYIECSRDYILDDCDFIILYSSDFYNSEESDRIKDMAFRISEEKNKRVSIGYSYIIPEAERQYESVCDGIELASFKNSCAYEETTFGSPSFDPLELVEMVVKTHDELESQKVKSKK